MRYVSVCAGIEAATVAWHHLGWEPAWFSEIEPFPSAVLAHHYPNVKNLGDMTRFETWPDATVELICAGTPCQSFSVAGLRQGLADPRGNLMLTFLAIAQRYRPRWVVWENVPGVLSSNGGRDFGTFLWALGELGYGWAYRVLDAQWFGVAQRRRRVFVVGCLGDWQRAAQVLFERESVRRDSAPSRETRQGVARRAGGGPKGGSISGAVTSKWAKGSGGPAGDECYNMVAHSLRGEGFDASEDGTGRGTPLVPITFGAQMSAPQTDVDMVQTLQAKNPMAVAFSKVGATLKGGSGERGYPDPSDGNGHNLVAQPVVYQDSQYGVGEYLTAGSLRAGRIPEHQMVAQPVAFQPTADCLTAAYGTKWNGNASADNGSLFAAQPVAFNLSGSSKRDFNVKETNVSACLGTKSQEPNETTQNSITTITTAMQVRRLTPVECERLQGFPDNYTNIPWRKKDESPDGPRYKALGNSMAVPVMRWIGERIAKVDA